MRRTYWQHLTVIATAMTVPLLFLAGPAQAQAPEDGGSHRDGAHRVERQDRGQAWAERDHGGKHAKANRDTEGKQAKTNRDTEGKQAKTNRDTEGKQAKTARDTEGKQVKTDRDTDGDQPNTDREAEREQARTDREAEREADREQRRPDDKEAPGRGNRPAQAADPSKKPAADEPLEMPLLAPPTSEPIPRPTPDAPPVTDDPQDDPETSAGDNQVEGSPPTPAGPAPPVGPAAPPEPATPVTEPVDAPVSDPQPATAGAPIASLWPIGGPSVGSVIAAAPDVPPTFPGVIIDDTPISDAVPLLLIVLGVFLAVQRGIGRGLGYVPMSGAVGRDRHGRS